MARAEVRIFGRRTPETEPRGDSDWGCVGGSRDGKQSQRLGYGSKAELSILTNGLNTVSKEKRGVQEHASVFVLKKEWMEVAIY